MSELEPTGLPPVGVNTTNDYALGAGQNMPNHSTTMNGRGNFVKPMIPTLPIFRTKQEAYRFTAWLLLMADNHLPDEEGAHTLEEVTAAVRNA
jgi:hypothetical protein